MKAAFINQLQVLGLKPQEPVTGKVYFEWIAPVGGNAGKKVLVGVTVSDAYPAACPSAPHFRPLDEGWKNHPDAVSVSAFGQGWQKYPDAETVDFYQTGWYYWSRKFDEWAASEKNAKFYLAHLKKLMMTV